MLSKKHRLAKEKDFQEVFKKGKFFAEGFITARIKENKLDFSRFGFVITLKVSKKAVKRNLIRRRLQEAAKSFLGEIKPGYDVVAIPKADGENKTYQEIRDAFKKILRKAGILEEKAK